MGGVGSGMRGGAEENRFSTCTQSKTEGTQSCSANAVFRPALVPLGEEPVRNAWSWLYPKSTKYKPAFLQGPQVIHGILKFETHSWRRVSCFASGQAWDPLLQMCAEVYTTHSTHLLRLRTCLLNKHITICLGTNILKVYHFHKYLGWLIMDYCSNPLVSFYLSTIFPLILLHIAPNPKSIKRIT